MRGNRLLRFLASRTSYQHASTDMGGDVTLLAGGMEEGKGGNEEVKSARTPICGRPVSGGNVPHGSA